MSRGAATGTPVADEDALGLRERKKLRTRREIADATVRLAAEHGLDGITVEQIAAAAEVAPRTFFRYFDSKEDALLADHAERVALLRVALEARPADEGPVTAVRAAVLEVADDLEVHRDLLLRKAELMEQSPTLRGRSLETMAELERTIAAALATRMGVDPEHDLRPGVIAGAVTSAMRVAVDRWVASGGHGELRETVVTALDLLEGGLDRSVGDHPVAVG